MTSEIIRQEKCFKDINIIEKNKYNKLNLNVKLNKITKKYHKSNKQNWVVVMIPWLYSIFLFPSFQ